MKLSINSKKLMLLIALTFCTGIFLSNYFTFSNGLFLAHFDHSHLPIAYIVSGLAGVVLIRGYAFAKTKLDMKNLFGFTLVFIALCAFCIWALYHADIKRTILVFISFSFLSSFYTLVGLQLWGITFNLFDVRSSKRMFARIGLGGVSASLIGFLLAGQVAARYSDNPENMLLMGCIALSVAVVVQQILMFRYFKPEKAVAKEKQGHSIRSLFRSNMVVLLFSMMIISVFLQYLIDYNFLKGSKQLVKLYNDQAASTDTMDMKYIPMYFAYIFAGIKLVEIILRSASGYIFKNLGMGRILLILPTIFILLYLSITVADFSLSLESYQGFKVLFLVILASKIFDRSLRSALDDPARKMLYQPMDAESRHHAQIYIDGYAKQLAIALGGAFLLLINFISLQYWQMGMLVVILSAFWLLIAKNSRTAYTRLLKDFLKLEPVARDATTLATTIEEETDRLDSFERDLGNAIIERDRRILFKHWRGVSAPDEELSSILLDTFVRVKNENVKLRLIALAHKYDQNSFLEKAFFISRFDKRFTIAILPYFSNSGFTYEKGTHEIMFETVLQKCMRNLVWLKEVSTDLEKADISYQSLRTEIGREITEKFLILFEILAIKKNRYDIVTLKHHLMSEFPSDSRLFAIELFDVIFQDESEQDLKEILLSIFENNTKVIKRNFVVYRANAHERLEELLYADLFKIGIETKRTAFRLMCEKHSRMYPSQISGCWYHPDVQIQKLAREYGEI